MLFNTLRTWKRQSTATPQSCSGWEAVLPAVTIPHHYLQAPAPAYLSPCLHSEHDSNQRTRNQFRPRNATKGTSSYQLRQYAEATLGGGSLRKIVKLPEGEDENEWLAVNSKAGFHDAHESPRLTLEQWSISTTISTSSTDRSPSSALHNHAQR